MASENNYYLNLHIIAFYPDAMANWFMPLKASTQQSRPHTSFYSNCRRRMQPMLRPPARLCPRR
jgi:hypothetical protein